MATQDKLAARGCAPVTHPRVKVNIIHYLSPVSCCCVTLYCNTRDQCVRPWKTIHPENKRSNDICQAPPHLHLTLPDPFITLTEPC